MSAPAGPKKHRLPATFRSLSTLRVLNVLALASSLAAATGAAFGAGLSSTRKELSVVALTTFVCGLAWAILMRRKKTLKNSTLRVGWLLSIPLAAANGGMACGALMALDEADAHVGRMLAGFVLGATFGAIIWFPALVAVLVVYGVPIAKAQSLAEKGLAGEERGERIVGIVSALIAVVAIIAVPPAGPRHDDLLSALALPLIVGFGALGGLTGFAATVLASYRDGVRRAFVREVESGGVEGFRVDATNEGKVLVRVSTQGAGYRAATFEEQVYGLDDGGAAGRALTGEP